MDIEKMGGGEVYARYLALASKDYTIVPFANKCKSKLDYFLVDGAANWGNNLFHYCVIDTLKIIIEKKQLRFTNIQYLDDTTEFQAAIELLKLTIKSKKSFINEELYNILTDEKIFHQLDDYFQRYPFYPPINDKRNIDSVKPFCRVYTCSFSFNGDSSSMWNDYASGDNGVSINFTELKEYMKSNGNVKIIWGKVLYDEDDKRQCIEALLKDIMNLFLQIPDKNCRKDMIQTVFISAINNMRIFMKYNDYSEEEYRAVLIVPEEVIDNNGLPDGYTQGYKQKNIDKPYIDVPFDLESITNIIINPDGDFDSINADMEDWLQKQNLNDIRIWKSNIPVRKY